MKRRNGKRERKIKESLFPPVIFGIYYFTLLLMSGFHIGIIVLMGKINYTGVLWILAPIIYWGVVASGLTLFTRKKIKNTYEVPMSRLADATAKVSNGDFSVYVSPIHTPDKLDYLDIMIMDFNKMVEELGSIETLKTDFISNISHEMKTPIAIIKNYAELLSMEKISEEKRKEYAQSIEDAARKLSNLISNILKLNKLENQRIIPMVEDYDVCRQLCDCILQFEASWEEKNLDMIVEIEDVARIKADESLLEIVWNNLLSNAIKFTEPGGSITVRQTWDEENLMVSISDTGCGMREEYKNRIFDKFYQVDTSHATDGNGLGLALVKRVLELMDGEIRIDSEEGKGSTFTVTLPLAKIENGE